MNIFVSAQFQTNFLNVYLTDLRQICRVGRTAAVDNQPEIIVFRSLKGSCRDNQFLLYPQN